MKKLFRYTILFSLVGSVGLYLYISQSRVSITSPTENLPIYTNFYNKDIYFLRPSGEPSVIKSVQVIKDEPKLLELSVIFTYDGKEGTEVSTCGGVIKQDMVGYSNEWNCRPTRLKIGKNIVRYRFELLDDQPAEYYCTGHIRVNMYKHGGSDFVNQLFSYKKTWINGEGFYAQFKQLVYGYLKCK
jgi:hypothetical protein